MPRKANPVRATAAKLMREGFSIRMPSRKVLYVMYEGEAVVKMQLPDPLWDEAHRISDRTGIAERKTLLYVIYKAGHLNHVE